MKIALRIWFLAVLVESLLYIVFEEGLGIIVFPYALVGGLPGMFVFGLINEAIDTLIDKGKLKWLCIALAALLCANGTLILFLLLLGVENVFPPIEIYSILNVATLIAFLLSLRQIKKAYFTDPEPLFDLDDHSQPYIFKNLEHEN